MSNTNITKKAEDIALGKIGSNSHPAHPATVHYPLAFFTASYGLDIVYGLATHPATKSLTNSVVNFAPHLLDAAKFSHYANVLGLLTAFPAIATGGAELLAMIRGQDLANKFKKSDDKTKTAAKMHPKMKMAFAHAVLNDAVFLVSAYNWWTRRSVPYYIPGTANVWLSALAMGMLMASGYLGGQMVYRHGVGVERQGTAKRLKEEGKAE
ncbi:hypothetical protein EJ06DRAFT_579719 [Trichodelitschia bisporula]|uniref:DUF2231 domain-containing protein n=1 Tax=Trichodelitschia bisporula TaxID=703511 RepID=A0A6G1I6T6_9PEZI|nr:hypothetical protein EJ06DRAFT_579719 [Trichodelitschia bisporula]